MTNNRNYNVLKGQCNLAQGSALGINASKKIVRVMVFFKRQFLLRTKEISSCLLENKMSKFRPEEVFRTNCVFPADGLPDTSLAQGVALG